MQNVGEDGLYLTEGLRSYVSVDNKSLTDSQTKELYNKIISAGAVKIGPEGYEIDFDKLDLSSLEKRYGLDAGSLRAGIEKGFADNNLLSTMYTQQSNYASTMDKIALNQKMVGEYIGSDWIEENDKNSGIKTNIFYQQLGAKQEEIASNLTNEEILSHYGLSNIDELRKKYYIDSGIDPESEEAKKIEDSVVTDHYANQVALEQLDNAETLLSVYEDINDIKIENVGTDKKEKSLAENELEKRQEFLELSNEELGVKKQSIKESQKYSKEVKENDKLITHIALSELEMANAASDIAEA